MTKLLKTVVAFVSGTFLLQACTTPSYTVSTQNTPILTGEGDGPIAAGASLAAKHGSFDLSASYAPTAHLGIMATANAITFIPNGRSNYFDLGAGYFSRFDKQGLFAVFAGYGGGTFTLFDTQFGTFASDYGRFFVQPQVGFTTTYFDMVFSTRISSLNYYNYHPIFTELAENRDINRNITMMEPAITFRGGSPSFRVQLQFAFGKALNSSKFDYDPANINLSLCYTFNRNRAK